MEEIRLTMWYAKYTIIYKVFFTSQHYCSINSIVVKKLQHPSRRSITEGRKCTPWKYVFDSKNRLHLGGLPGSYFQPSRLQCFGRIQSKKSFQVSVWSQWVCFLGDISPVSSLRIAPSVFGENAVRPRSEMGLSEKLLEMADGFKCLLFSPLFEEDVHPFWRSCFSRGLVGSTTNPRDIGGLGEQSQGFSCIFLLNEELQNCRILDWQIEW